MAKSLRVDRMCLAIAVSTAVHEICLSSGCPTILSTLSVLLRASFAAVSATLFNRPATVSDVPTKSIQCRKCTQQ